MKSHLAEPFSAVAVKVHGAVLAQAQTYMAEGDAGIFHNWKVMLGGGLSIVLAITLIAVGSIHTIARVREGIGEAIMFQIGLIVLGVLIALSVGIAAGIYVFAGNHGIVDPEFVHSGEWKS